METLLLELYFPLGIDLIDEAAVDGRGKEAKSASRQIACGRLDGSKLNFRLRQKELQNLESKVRRSVASVSIAGKGKRMTDIY